MDINRSITFIFNDPDWIKKLAIAGLVSLIPVVGIFVLLGWALEITRRVIMGDNEVLPDFGDFGGMMGNGFKVFVVQLLYSLPIILLFGCMYALMIAGTLAMGGDLESMDRVMGGGMMVVVACVVCLTIPLAIMVGLGNQAARGILAETGEISQALKFGKVMEIVKKGVGKYLLAYLVIILAATILSPIGGLLCGIGALFTSAFIVAFDAHLVGQIYKFANPNATAPATTPGTVEIL